MPIKLEKKDILEYQQNRDPYLMIDYADEIVPGKSAKGYKYLNKDEWFFKVHWPTDPNMPGMLQVEALVQMSSLAILTLPGNKGKILYLVSADKLKLIQKITPESKLVLETKVLSFKRGLAKCEGVGFVEKKKVCSAEFTLILPDVIKSFNLNK